jgi:hypothetical protein
MYFNTQSVFKVENAYFCSQNALGYLWRCKAGHCLLGIPNKLEPDTDRESDAMTYTGVHCLDVIFKMGDTSTLSTMLGNLIFTLAYIYSIHICM